MSERVKRPGYMTRAVIAWVIFNTILFVTLATLIFLLGPYIQSWYVMVPLIVGVIASEWIIMGETIAPIMKEWIAQEEYVATGEKPSWEKGEKA